MKIRTLLGAFALVLFAAPAHAGWFNWLHTSWTPPEPVHLIQGGFHRSESAGKQVVRSPKEYKDQQWGRTAGPILRHPARSLTPHLRNRM
jgi:hypothetical protein